MAVTQYETKFKRQKKGICSYWLASQSPSKSDIIPIWLKKGSFRFPKDDTSPIIMVGPGTGIAVFRSFIQKYGNSGRKLVLLFGCRNKTSDYYY